MDFLLDECLRSSLSGPPSQMGVLVQPTSGYQLRFVKLPFVPFLGELARRHDRALRRVLGFEPFTEMRIKTQGPEPQRGVPILALPEKRVRLRVNSPGK